MASTNNDTDTIDLTLDDDSPHPTSRLSSESPEDYFPSPSPLRESAENEQRTAPPFLAGNVAEPLEVIDLSDEEEEVAPRPVQRTRAVPVRSSSPDIEFIHERPAQAALARPDPPVQPAARREPWHPPQPPAFHRAINFVRQNTQNIFGNFQPHLPFFPAMAPVVHDGGGAPVDEGDGLGAINFNYEQAAFQVGNRDSEPPQAMHSPYKAPPAPLDGCTRTYEEESILICPSCSNELASGGKDENDLQRQVWVNKACGHVSPRISCFFWCFTNLLRSIVVHARKADILPSITITKRRGKSNRARSWISGRAWSMDARNQPRISKACSRSICDPGLEFGEWTFRTLGMKS